jgi:inner membrane protein
MHEEHSLPNFHLALIWPLLLLLSGTRKTEDDEPHKMLHGLLLKEARALGVTAYEALIAELLQAIGYEQVQPLRGNKRRRRSHKGRNAHGGVDIIARSRSGLATDAILVQVKQYERPVSRRFVDELRGALLRTESRHALLITTSHFSPAAIKAASEDHVAPVHLMDGEKLCRLLIQHQIGMRPGSGERPLIDAAFFQSLNRKYPSAENAARRAKTPVQVKTHYREVNGLLEAANPATQKGGGMMGRTHAFIGIAALWLMELPGVVTQETIVPLIFFAAVGALLPDLDAGESLLKRFAIGGIAPLAPVSAVLHRTLGHRGLLHSLAGIGIFTALCALPVALWLGWLFGAALMLGYASHIAADAATKSGVPLLYPRRKRYHLLPKGWRLTTGSLAEEMLLPFLAFAVLLLLLRHLYLVS